MSGASLLPLLVVGNIDMITKMIELLNSNRDSE